MLKKEVGIRLQVSLRPIIESDGLCWEFSFICKSIFWQVGPWVVDLTFGISPLSSHPHPVGRGQGGTHGKHTYISKSNNQMSKETTAKNTCYYIHSRNQPKASACQESQKMQGLIRKMKTHSFSTLRVQLVKPVISKKESSVK
jgi:hypothetical protein